LHWCALAGCIRNQYPESMQNRTPARPISIAATIDSMAQDQTLLAGPNGVSC